MNQVVLLLLLVVFVVVMMAVVVVVIVVVLCCVSGASGCFILIQSMHGSRGHKTLLRLLVS